MSILSGVAIAGWVLTCGGWALAGWLIHRHNYFDKWIAVGKKEANATINKLQGKLKEANKKIDELQGQKKK